MTRRFSRTEYLLGDEAVRKLASSRLLIVGVGGVGGYAAELLCRAGIGNITLVDGDIIDETNLNRQIIALYPSIGKSKVSEFASRLLSINPDLNVDPINLFLQEDNIPEFLDSTRFDFIVDAIDSVGPKCSLIREAFKRGIPIISSMGAGARVDVGKVKLEKLYKTHHDGLSKAVRRRLDDNKIASKLTVVFSSESPMIPKRETDVEDGRKRPVGTISYIPAVFGCYLTQYVINNLITKTDD